MTTALEDANHNFWAADTIQPLDLGFDRTTDSQRVSRDGSTDGEADRAATERLRVRRRAAPGLVGDRLPDWNHPAALVPGGEG